MNRRLAVALTASITVLAAAPGIGLVRGAVQDALPDYYRGILIGTVAVAVAGAVVVAVRRITDRHALRYGLLGLAMAIGAAYSLATATGVGNVDAVERFHFVEYGLLTLLFFRAGGGRTLGPSDPRTLGVPALTVPFLAVFIVGTLDEWIQWLVPGRVGEWRDVVLNSVAIACGVLFGLGIEGAPGRLQAASTRAAALRGGRLQAALAIAALAVFAVFFYVVHVGYDIRDPAIGTFRSRYSAEELLAHAADRAVRWTREPLSVLRPYSREDQYLAEGLWHIQRRNEMAGEGGVWATWKENLILEKYFVPVLDIATYATPGGARWPADQRANAAAVAAGAGDRPFESDAHPFPIYPWLGR